MRYAPFIAIGMAALLAGCAGESQVDLRGEADRLAKIIDSEQDHVSVAELSDWIIKEKGDFELVDVREEGDFTAGHIESARHIPLASLMSDAALDSLPEGRKVVVYSNGTAHAHAAALLLRLVDREAYALLGGHNYWQAYLNDPAAAGVAEMDAAERAEYQAVACYFEGDYVAEAGLLPKGGMMAEAGKGKAGGGDETSAGDDLGLGLGLGLGSEEVRESQAAGEKEAEGSGGAGDALGLGLGLGDDGGGEKKTRKLLIKAEC